MIRNFYLLLLLFSALAWASDAHPGATPQVPAQVNDGVLRLDDVVREALSRNPAISSASHMVDAQRHRVPQARAFPDPTVAVGYMGNATPFTTQKDDPSSYRNVQAMQMIPFFGKRGARARVAQTEVGIASSEVEMVRRRVATEAKTAFFDYVAATRTLEVAQRNRELMKKLSEIADARYRVGKAMQQDVLKSQLEITMLLQRITMLEQQKATAQARLNTLMLRPPQQPLPPPEVPELRPIAVSLDQLTQLAVANDAEVARTQKTIERGQAMVALAHKETIPDLTLGYMYQQRPDMPDMYGMTFGVNIPIFTRGKQREAVEQGKQEIISAEQTLANRRNEILFELQQQYLAARASEQLVTLYSKAAAPQASLAMESAMAAYQTGTVDFLSVMSNFGAVLNSESEYYRELANYYTALSRIEALTGTDVTAPVAQASTPKEQQHAQ